MVAVIEDGGYARGMMDRIRELEARQDEIAGRLSAAPVDIPDIHPNIAIVYRRKVERLADPRDRDEAADAIRGLIERIVLTPGEKRGQMDAALRGDLGTILEWAGNGRGKGTTDTPRSGMSVSLVAGACFQMGPDLTIAFGSGLNGSSGCFTFFNPCLDTSQGAIRACVCGVRNGNSWAKTDTGDGYEHILPADARTQLGWSTN